jgi:AcrR family transcriptional regulator
MAAQGAAALSLRAIARDMGMTAPALYRYFQSRDDLVTALILDAFNALADTLEAARDTQPEDNPAARLLATLNAYRDWALAHPADFTLIFGTPIPGYEAPRELTIPAAVRNYVALGTAIAGAMQRGVLVPPSEYSQFPPSIQAALESLRVDNHYDVPLSVLYLTVVILTQMHGLVTLELFGHTGPAVGDTAEFYRFEMGNMLRRMGLQMGNH